MQYKTFETERLLIRPCTEEDAEFILELLNSPKWLQNIGDRGVRTVEQARQYICDRMLPQLRQRGFANNVLILKETGQKIGACGLYSREGLPGIDIGFAFLPEFEQKGFGFEAASRVLRAAFQDFGLSEVYGITMKTNRASQRLLEKIGLQQIGTTILPHETEELLLSSGT